MRFKLTIATIGALVALVLAACVPLPGGETPTTRLPIPAGPLSPAEVFAHIAPSVAFIETPAGTGSGFLIEGSYLLTNAHVVYPYSTVRVVFPDGSEFADATVLNWDLMADIAVIGPLATSLPSLPLAADERLPMGSETYLIGYPEELETFPQPTITRGVLSRRREWAAIAFTYLQSDALILGGQSGGVLASAHGEVLGMSGLGWPSISQFALAASIVDVMPRVEALIAGQDIDGLGPRRLPKDTPQTQFEVVLAHRHDARIFEIPGKSGDDVTLELSGTDDFEAVLFDFAGSLYETGDNSDGSTLNWQVRWDAEGPFLLALAPLADGPITVVVSSTAPLRLFPDPDDARNLEPGQTVAGSIDHPLDSDVFLLALKAGQRIEARADSLAINPALVIDYPDAPEDAIAFDSDSGGGLYDDVAQLVYQAPADGVYFVIVRKEGGSFMLDPDTGGYILTVQDVTAEQDAMAATRAPTIAAPPPELEDADSDMYVDPYERFAMHLPSEWEHRATTDFDAALLIEPGGAALHISTADIPSLGLGDLTLGDYVNVVIADYRAQQHDFQLETRWRLQTDAGQFGEVLVYSDLSGQRKSSEFIFTPDSREAYHIRFSATPERHRDLTPLINQALKTFVFLPGSD